MAFKKGDPKPPTSGIKKGTKHQRTLAEEACKRAGICPFDLLVQMAVGGDVGAVIQLCKHIEPPRKPLDVAIDPESNVLKIVIEDYGQK